MVVSLTKSRREPKEEIQEEARKILKFKRRSGFTLVEIMVVVVIMGLLVTIVATNVLDRLEEARRTAARLQINAFESSLDM